MLGIPDPGMSPEHVRIRELLHGFEVTQTLYVLARLGIPDMIAGGPMSSEAMAQRLGVRPGPLMRILRMATVLGVVTQDREYRFGPTRISGMLQSDSPGGFRDLAILSGEEYYRAAGKFPECLTTGKSGFESAYGVPFFEYLTKHPAAQATFNASMLVRIDDHRAVAEAYDFAKHRTVADVGGGRGGLLSAILVRCASLHGILFDQPNVLPEASEYLSQQGVLDRCTLIGGDALEAVPVSADVFVESYFLHDFEDVDAEKILRNIRQVIPGEGTLLLVEHIISDDATPSMAKLMDLRMLELGGIERTKEEWSVLTGRTGFRIIEIRDIGKPARLIVCKPA